MLCSVQEKALVVIHLYSFVNNTIAVFMVGSGSHTLSYFMATHIKGSEPLI
jgi:hypothetical protein